MEKVFSRLSEIEEKAESMIQNTAVEKERLHNQFEEDIKLLEEQIQQDTDNKLKELRIQMAQDIEKEKCILMEDCSKHLEALSDCFHQHYNELADKIFNQIVGT